jgi:hypothetical protein
MVTSPCSPQRELGIAVAEEAGDGLLKLDEDVRVEGRDGLFEPSDCSGVG